MRDVAPVFRREVIQIQPRQPYELTVAQWRAIRWEKALEPGRDSERIPTLLVADQAGQKLFDEG